MRSSRLAAVCCCLAIVACNKKSPPPTPAVDSPGTVERITGTERLGWDQRASDAVELATVRYAIYVDGTRSEATGVSCANTATSAGFACSARLPSMSQGPHTLELTAFTADGAVLESSRSQPLQVMVVAAGAAGAPQQTPWPSRSLVATADGVALQLELVADGLDRPADIAFAPDGRIFIAERSGRIRIVRKGRLLDEPALMSADGGFVALALDRDFDRTGFVYTIGTSDMETTPAEAARHAAFWLARFRETANTFAERAILLDDVRASPTGSASLRFGADGKLYAAFDDGGDRRLAGDLASRNGKVLRLNPDGTTPTDQAAATPVYSYPFHSPRGLDWDPTSHALWMADADSPTTARLSVISGIAGRETRGVVRGAYALTSASTPSSIAFYHGLIPEFRDSLFVASEEGRHLLRVRIDPNDPTRVLATERLLQDRIGGVRVVAVGPDGGIYFCTENAIGRMMPAKSSTRFDPSRAPSP